MEIELHIKVSVKNSSLRKKTDMVEIGSFVGWVYFFEGVNMYFKRMSKHKVMNLCSRMRDFLSFLILQIVETNIQTVIYSYLFIYWQVLMFGLLLWLNISRDSAHIIEQLYLMLFILKSLCIYIKTFLRKFKDVSLNKKYHVINNKLANAHIHIFAFNSLIYV